MRHPIYRIVSFDMLAPYTLCIHFDDGAVRTINFLPLLVGELFGPLRDLALFNQVRIDPEVQTLIWPNGADFDPATLHDWADHEHLLLERARRWAALSTSSGAI